GGQSRGGVLSVAYSGAHAEQVFGVVNFVGGWMGEACATARSINQNLFEQGARFKRPTLWLYGRRDPFYSISHSRDNFAAFQKAGWTRLIPGIRCAGGCGPSCHQAPATMVCLDHGVPELPCS